MKQVLYTTIFFLITSILPIVNANILPDNCLHFGDWKQSECEQILNDASLSLEEKQDLYLNLINSQGELASFNFIQNWNNNIEWNQPPKTAAIESSGIIRGAWVKIVSVSNSFFDLDKKKWFAEPSGEILVEHNYSIELPTETVLGDCQTNYSYEILNENFEVKLNENSIGNQRLTEYFVEPINGFLLNFSAEFLVETKLIIDHFKEHEHCQNERCTVTCDFESTEYRFDNVNLADAFFAKVKNQSVLVKIFLSEGLELNKFIIKLESVEPVNFFEFRVGNNFFSLSETNFDLNATVDGVLFATKSYKKVSKINGFVELESKKSGFSRKIVLASTGGGDCSYSFFTDFFEEQKTCSLTKLEPVEIVIESGADFFDFEDKIDLNVNLLSENGEAISNENVLVGFGENSVELTTDSSGTASTNILAKETNGVIVAGFSGNEEYASAKSVKRVSLQRKKTFDDAQLVVGFFGAYYFVFLISKKVLAGAI